MPISIINYKGKSIHFFDHTNCKTEEMLLQDLDDLVAHLKKQPAPILTLEDYSNIFVGSNFMVRAKENGALFKIKRSKGALIGVTGLKKILLNGYVRFTGENLKAFDTKEQALEYLID